MSLFVDREAVERRHIEWMALLPLQLHSDELIGGGAAASQDQRGVESFSSAIMTFFISAHTSFFAAGLRRRYAG